MIETEKKVKVDEKTLVDAFVAAKAAAEAADPGQANDGGTCNFDTPTLYLPGIREKFVEQCAEKAGIRASAFKWFGGRRYFFIYVPMQGQGDRRTKMAEAGCKALEAAGLPAMMYYQMD